jgi:hypothetical protein
MKKGEQPDPARPPLEGEPAIHADVAYEPRDVEASRVLIFGVALALTIVAAGGVVWWALHELSASQARSEPPVSPLRVGAPRQLPPEPRLQGIPGHAVAAPEELREMQDSANAALNSYGWVDQKAEIARIPIEEAMKRLAAQGLPAVQQTPAGGASNVGKPAAGQAAPSPKTSGKKP